MTTVQDWEMANERAAVTESQFPRRKTGKNIQGNVFPLSCPVLHVAPQKKFALPKQREKPIECRAISLGHHLPQAESRRRSAPWTTQHDERQNCSVYLFGQPEGFLQTLTPALPNKTFLTLFMARTLEVFLSRDCRVSLGRGHLAAVLQTHPSVTCWSSPTCRH